MKTLVTGAAGFVGSTIVRQLLADGAEVRALVREGSDLRNLDGLEVEVVRGDTRDRGAMKAALAGCDTLFHVAAHFAHWSLDPALFYQVNVEGTRTVLEEALGQGLARVVYTSTANCMGAHGAGVLADEQAEFNELETGDHYAISKHQAELEARRICARGLPLVIVNPTLVIGVRDRKPTPSGKLIIDIANRSMPGYIDGATNVIDVEDVARGHLLAARRGRIGERYILGNANVTVGELFALVARIAGVSPPRLKLPYGAAIALGHVLDAWARLTRHPPVFSLSQVRIGGMGEHFSNAKAVSELGLTLTPLEETVRKTVGWFAANGFVKRRA